MKEYELLKPIRTEAGFTILPTHYSHDPEKDEEWLQAERRKYKLERLDWEGDWNREMEMDFTVVVGAAAYPAFTSANTALPLQYQPFLPLRLCCDFNVEPMVWVVCQVVRGDVVMVIDEICMAPASIPEMVREFRNRFPAHPAEVWVYGDATGRGRNPQTAQSDYDIMKIGFRGYPVEVKWRVSYINPRVKDRLHSVNMKLKGVDGEVKLFVDKSKCPELHKDFQEVAQTQDGSQIVKVKNRDDPYYWRTHASDALGYFIHREWPVFMEALRNKPKKKPRPRRGAYLGEL